MPKVHFVKSARKDIYGRDPLQGTQIVKVKVGQSYYWWKFRNLTKRVSLTPPTPRDLRHPNKSTWDLELQDWENEVERLESEPDETEIQDLISELQDKVDEMRDSLDNMPEHLQESHCLTERIEELEGLISTLEGIETDEY